jgi:hypothetical protein
METGMQAHMQVNNIAYFNYHRINGDTLAKVSNPATSSTSSVVYPTEAGIGVMNLISSMHY